MGTKLNLINQKFDRLLVIDTAPNKNGRTAWVCKCDCGNELIVTTHSLRNGNTKSCGCLHKEKVAKQFSKDISNQRFGNLTALKPTEMRKHGSVVWECVCDCGNTHLASTEMLLSGKVSSCGCIRSKGNQKIKNLLQKNMAGRRPDGEKTTLWLYQQEKCDIILMEKQAHDTLCR